MDKSEYGDVLHIFASVATLCLSGPLAASCDLFGLPTVSSTSKEYRFGQAARALVLTCKSVHDSYDLYEGAIHGTSARVCSDSYRNAGKRPVHKHVLPSRPTSEGTTISAAASSRDMCAAAEGFNMRAYEGAKAPKGHPRTQAAIIFPPT